MMSISDTIIGMLLLRVLFALGSLRVTVELPDIFNDKLSCEFHLSVVSKNLFNSLPYASKDFDA